MIFCPDSPASPATLAAYESARDEAILAWEHLQKPCSLVEANRRLERYTSARRALDAAKEAHWGC